MFLLCCEDIILLGKEIFWQFIYDPEICLYKSVSHIGDCHLYTRIVFPSNKPYGYRGPLIGDKLQNKLDYSDWHRNNIDEQPTL